MGDSQKKILIPGGKTSDWALVEAAHKLGACSEDLPYCVIFETCDNVGMFLKANNRDKDGKAHFYWGLMKNVRDQLDLTLSTQPAPKGFSSSVCTSQTAM